MEAPLLLVMIIASILHGTAHGFGVENWNQPTSSAFVMYGNPQQGSATSGAIDPSANDGLSLLLRLHPNTSPGVGGAPAAETFQQYQFGSYWSRVKAGNCSNQPRAGVVTGIFTYYNDGQDRNGNGVVDNLEIDFEFLCSSPYIVHLSIWTDYEDKPAGTEFKQVYRTINLRTGQIISQCYRERFGYCGVGSPEENYELTTPEEASPPSVQPIPGFDSSTAYYEYGILYEESRVAFILRNQGGQEYLLWDYRNATRIPKVHTMHYLLNLWHTNNWWPEDKDENYAEQPTLPVWASVDWSTFTPEG